MEFTVLKLTANGNLLLRGSEPRGVSGMDLFEAGKKAATVFDTIGRVESPLYLAKPHVDAKSLVGKALGSVR
ncbi:MAG: hypothetical protein V1708_03040 [Candidatus Micrarchaeota archaeon]